MKKVVRKECHFGNKLVHKFKYRGKEIHLYCGGLFRGFNPHQCDVVISTVDLQIPMSTLKKDFLKDFRDCEIIYMPVFDFGAPEYTLEDYRIAMDLIVDNIKKDKIKVGICCEGGHGRTGTVASVILYHFAGMKDPIGHLRKVYCVNAVESEEQMEYLERFGIPVKNYLPTKITYSYNTKAYIPRTINVKYKDGHIETIAEEELYIYLEDPNVIEIIIDGKRFTPEEMFFGGAYPSYDISEFW